MTQTADPGPDLELPAPRPAATSRTIAYAVLWLAIPLVVVVLWVMAGSAAATGGCGGG